MVVSKHAIKVNNLFTTTEDERRAVAENFDMLITGDWNTQFLAELKTVNPSLLIIIYRNVCFIDIKVTEEIDVARANGWILKDSTGEEVYQINYPDLRLADVGNPGYQDMLAEICYLYVQDINTDGIMGDSMALRPRVDIWSAWPINPRTGAEYTDGEWNAGIRSMVAKIKTFTGKLLIGNGYGMICGCNQWMVGYWNSKNYADPVINLLDGVLVEGFIRFSGTDWRTPDVWLSDIEYFRTLSAKGKTDLAWVITSGLPAGATVEQVAMFGFASYLLAKKGNNTYFVVRGYESQLLPVSKADVGVPVGDYFLRPDAPVYQRNYTNVKVLVNPTDTSYTIQVEGATDPIVMEAHTGTILDIPTPALPWWNLLIKIVGPIGVGLYLLGRPTRRG